MAADFQFNSLALKLEKRVKKRKKVDSIMCLHPFLPPEPAKTHTAKKQIKIKHSPINLSSRETIPALLV
jgi:hypothetical protein